MSKIPLVVIAGPTASGKTAFSIELAKRLDGEIVSADSMQIYKYMNIGTAKPTTTEKCDIPHHLMDFLEPSKNFSVSDYCNMAHKIIYDVYARGKLPIIVGGTGLYIDSLVNNVDFGKSEGDLKMRQELEELAQREGNIAVHNILCQIDPETAAKYHPNNLRRIIRAIEFYRLSGTTISAHSKEEKNSPYKAVWFAINLDREVLYERINRRVDIMLKEGLLDEVKSLYNRNFDPSSTAMQGIGYKELYAYFNGALTLSEAAELIKINSRRYAKRQLTWFRRNKDIHWLEFTDNMVNMAEEIIKEELFN